MSEKPLTERIRPNEAPASLKDYERAGGYASVRKCLSSMQPADVTQLVKDGTLRGRGGAGFPTGIKWSIVPQGADAPRPKYLVVNADEMEPGTFKDRVLLEGDPHQLIEGIILASFAIQADIAYIFLRGEYIVAQERIEKAIHEAYEAGFLGKDIIGSGYCLELHLHMSIGRYICGEETALLNALEGKRATPRAKPPFPQASGLWGKPTIVNNVETLSTLPHIVNRGVEWFKGLSRTPNGGTKLFGVSGKVKRPGLWELPLGTTVGEIMDLAGGMRDGLSLRGIIPGGASTDFLGPEHLDLQMDFDTVGKAGSRMGTGTMIVLDDKTCPVGMVHNLTQFFAHESCGWCTPCRDGLPWLQNVLWAIETGRGREDDMKMLHRHTKLLGPGMTFCALAPGAMAPLGSALTRFKDDFDQHIRAKRCPWR
ncbi:MAG: NADH-quinone oxidoreductase subunit NuoF [Candidatus Hydrogenedentes bacterium]|nr:NADH-quinone oxidoreductase subunit NuoF [Candidatus Hydrogenedentota bacterium]